MADLPDLLVEIIEHKRQELQAARAARPLAEVKRRAADRPPPRDMMAALRRQSGGPVRIIGEVKRRSPSAGTIRQDFRPAWLGRLLAEAGVDAISVLTDEKYFGGHLDYLSEVQSAVTVPVLRKDFLVDIYQIYEARGQGADAVLLIADALEAGPLGELLAATRELGMAALVESHDESALERAVASGARLLGVNNRNLRTFAVDLGTTVRLAALVPAGRVLVSESGIVSADDVATVLASGVQAVLVGETLMRSPDPRETVHQFQAAR